MKQGQDFAWETAAQDFRADGGLRDIYVLDATPADWQAAFDHLRATYHPVRFTIDGEPATPPSSVAEIFPIWERAAPALHFEVGGVEVACHFFVADEIEFDLWPQDVTGPERLVAVAAFIRELASAVGKPAVLTMENMREAVILQADPATKRVVWLPPSDAPAG